LPPPKDDDTRHQLPASKNRPVVADSWVVDGRLGGQIGGWTDRRIDGRIDERTEEKLPPTLATSYSTTRQSLDASDL
jgi:hypothetical protein